MILSFCAEGTQAGSWRSWVLAGGFGHGYGAVWCRYGAEVFCQSDPTPALPFDIEFNII